MEDPEPLSGSVPVHAGQTDGQLTFRKLWVLMVTAFVDMIGFALIVPLLPFYATKFGADAFTVGLLIAAFAFGTMVTAPLWGRLSDHAGRKPVMLSAQLLSAAAFIIFAYADAIWLLFLCRFLQGVGGGNMGATSAYVSDAIRPEERAQAIGWITAANSLGVMIGPAIASFTVEYSHHAPGLIAAGLCLANFVFTWFWLREAPKVKNASDKPRPPLMPQMVAVVTHPAQPTHSLIWIYAAGMMAFMASSSIMALYLAHRFGITEKTIGYFYVGTGFVSLIMRGLILGPLVRNYGEVRVLRLGAVSLGAGMIAVTAATSPWLYAVAMLLIPTGTALLFPCTTSLITRQADPRQVGQTVGVQQAFGGASRLLAPIWAGAVFQAVGPRFPFWMGGGLVLLTAAMSLRFKPGQAPLPRRAREASDDCV